MYSSRGSGYGQQQYGSQSEYGQNHGSRYPGSSTSGAEIGSQISLSSRHPSIKGAPQETDIGGYRSHLSAASHYGTQYGSVYGSTSVSSSQPLRTNGLGSSVSGYVPTLPKTRGLFAGRGGSARQPSPDSPKFSSANYLSPSSRGYGQKGDDLYSNKRPGYIPIDRRQYAEQSSAYIGRELQNEPSSRYADSSNFGHQTDLYGRNDQASLLRGEQLLKIQSLHTSSVDGGVRQANYLTERNSALCHSDREAMHYGGRLESDPHGLSVRNTSYASQHNPTLLGIVPRQNLDDYIYAESSSNPGYGVSLPPGRDYGIGKGIHSAASLDLDYPGGIMARDGGGGLHIDNLRKDDRASYLREFELREEERRDNLRSRDKERERAREREHEREREYERERERQRELERQKSRDRERERMLERREKERERERERKRVLEVKRNQTPAGRAISKDRKERTPVPKSISRDARSSSSLQDPQFREASTRRSSPIKPIRRDYICKVSSSRLVDTERDYLTLEKRYPRLFVPSELSKVVVNWPKHKLTLSMHTAVSFEHDCIEDDGVDVKSTSTKTSALETGGKTVWNAKMVLMSGLSRTALEDLSSDKSFEDWVPHICNILKFAVLKKDHTLMGIGGSWDPTDGRDPSSDQSSLIQTMLRHSKDKLNLDLSNCRHWNPFLEIHYDRVGSDGVFNCKEITVLFVPDLSECLPSFDAWRTQWLTYREALTERDRLLSQEIKKAAIRGKGSSDTVEVTKGAEKKSPRDTSGTPRTATKKTVKKIIKRVVKKPMDDGKETSKKGEKSDEKGVLEKVAISYTTAPKEESTGTSSSKNFAKGKVAENDDNMDVDFKKDDVSEEKKVAEAGKKTPDSGSMQVQSTGKSLEEVKDKNASRTVEIKQNTGSLDTEKKEGHSSSCKKDIKTDENKKAEKKITTETQSEGKKIDRDNDDEKKLKERGGIDESRIQGKDRKMFEEPPRPGFILLTKRNKDSKLRSLSVSLDSLLDYTDKDTDESSFELSLFAETLFEMLQYQMGSRILEFLKKLRVKSVRRRNRRKRPPKAVRQRNPRKKQQEELLVKQNEEKSENKRQKTVEQKDKETSVTTKCTSGKDDTENPTKETVDRCQEISDKEALANTNATLRCKEVIGNEVADREVDNQDEDDDGGGDDNPEEDLEDDPEEDIEGDPEEGIEEDPEEDSEECKKMDIANSEKEDPTEEPQKREEKLEKTSDTITDPKAEAETDRKEERSRIDQTTATKPISEANKHMKQEGGTPNAALKREQTVDKELLQAFRFFDRNQTGYVRVEDMRKTIHSLGQFLSHREVKELVHRALLESNTGRDDRILYNKLVRLSL